MAELTSLTADLKIHAVCTALLNPKDALQFTSFTFAIKVCISVVIERMDIGVLKL